MSFSIGIVGLPNVGKSTLFKALTKKPIEIANYPFCTIDPNVGIVTVPDGRIDTLAKISQSEKIIPTAIEFYDIAGLVKDAHKGEGLGNKFLSHIREVKAIIHVVRGFTDKNIIHVSNRVDPKSDEETILLELIFADLEVVKKRLADEERKAKGHDKEAEARVAVLKKIQTHLEEGKPIVGAIHELHLQDEEKNLMKDLNLLTMKPIITVLNIDEGAATAPSSVLRPPSPARGEGLQSTSPSPLAGEGGLAHHSFSEGGGEGDAISISAKIEAELAELPPEEAQVYMKELGMQESGLDRLIKKSYEVLGLITFFTSGPKETRAWTVRQGAKAPEAAGVIHTDFEKGFIRAEIISYNDFISCSGEQGAKDQGKMRLEGKEYIIQDGDVAHFRFSV